MMATASAKDKRVEYCENLSEYHATLRAMMREASQMQSCVNRDFDEYCFHAASFDLLFERFKEIGSTLRALFPKVADILECKLGSR